MNAQAQRVPLQSVGDLMVPGEPLPFRVLDAEGRLLLAQGQRVMDVRQLQALLQRGASVVFEEAQAVREARAKTPGPGAGLGPRTGQAALRRRCAGPSLRVRSQG